MTRKQRLEARVRMDKHRRILIPAAMRKAMDAEAGDVLCLRLRDGMLRVETYKQRIAKAQAPCAAICACWSISSGRADRRKARRSEA
jgi:bifunctional DNA-binding transcriptional regulator/antitoxin component of YhaV-PrlF toxin-antitoxin module